MYFEAVRADGGKIDARAAHRGFGGVVCARPLGRRPLRIYTKGGDRGETGLMGGVRVAKDDLRVRSYGEVDELGCVLGLARAHGLPREVDLQIERIQKQLFSLGSQLATPGDGKPAAPRVHAEWIAALEREIDAVDAQVPPLKNFVLPGGAPGAAWLHLARAVCRRAERAIVALDRSEALDPLIEAYANRLSDWLFMMARALNHQAGVEEPLWHPPRAGD